MTIPQEPELVDEDPELIDYINMGDKWLTSLLSGSWSYDDGWAAVDLPELLNELDQ